MLALNSVLLSQMRKRRGGIEDALHQGQKRKLKLDLLQLQGPFHITVLPTVSHPKLQIILPLPFRYPHYLKKLLPFPPPQPPSHSCCLKFSHIPAIDAPSENAPCPRPAFPLSLLFLPPYRIPRVEPVWCCERVKSNLGFRK